MMFQLRFDLPHRTIYNAVRSVLYIATPITHTGWRTLRIICQTTFAMLVLVATTLTFWLALLLYALALLVIAPFGITGDGIATFSQVFPLIRDGDDEPE